MRPRTERRRPAPSGVASLSKPGPSSLTEQNSVAVARLGEHGHAPRAAVLPGVGERLADRAGEGVHHGRLDGRDVLGHHDGGRAAVAVLEAGGRRPQAGAEVAAAAHRARRPVQELAQLALLFVGQAHDVGIAGTALDDGQGLQHTVVQRAGHLLAGLRQRGPPLGLAQAGGHEAGHEPGEGVEHHARHDADRVAVGPARRARQLAGAAGQADRRPRQHAAAGPEGDARRHHAGEGPRRRQALRVGHAVVRQLVPHLEGDTPRPPRPPRPGRTAGAPARPPAVRCRPP